MMSIELQLASLHHSIIIHLRCSLVRSFMLLLLLYLLHILLGHIIVSLLIGAQCLPILRFIRSSLGRLVVLTGLIWQELQELL